MYKPSCSFRYCFHAYMWGAFGLFVICAVFALVGWEGAPALPVRLFGMGIYTVLMALGTSCLQRYCDHDTGGIDAAKIPR